MQDNSKQLKAFLASYSPQASQHEVWPLGEFDLTAAITDELPPDQFISSIRTVLLRPK